MIVEELKNKIDALSYKLNKMLSYGIIRDEYGEILKVSQELDLLISKYTKITISQTSAD